MNTFFEDEENESLMKEDKILNNSYNSGEFEYEAFPKEIRVDDRVAGQYKESLSDNIVGDRTEKMLEENIYDIFKKSAFFEKYKVPKRVDKNDMIKMYYYFKDLLIKEERYSNVEIFIAFAEFFQINYDQLYTQIGVKDKEGLLKELHEKYHLTEKMAQKRLF